MTCIVIIALRAKRIVIGLSLGLGSCLIFLVAVCQSAPLKQLFAIKKLLLHIPYSKSTLHLHDANNMQDHGSSRNATNDVLSLALITKTLRVVKSEQQVAQIDVCPTFEYFFE